jgi:hypothetical protein
MPPLAVTSPHEKGRVQNKKKGGNCVGSFLIFLVFLLIMSISGITVWWIWSRVNIAIKRRESVFDVEKETHKKIKEKIQEEE